MPGSAAVTDAVCLVTGDGSMLSCRQLSREGLTTGQHGLRQRHCRPGSVLIVLTQAVKY